MNIQAHRRNINRGVKSTISHEAVVRQGWKRPRVWLSLGQSLSAAVMLRVVFMVYGLWQDAVMQVKYTDVDYFVFTDAAQFLAQGDSPYERPTYRYSPILAWLLIPNVIYSPMFGKVLFIQCDIMAGGLIYLLVRQAGKDYKTAVYCSWLWLFNPLPITVSSRGNAESIMAVMVLASIYFLQRRGTITLVTSAVLYGVSVHFKIYPITYALPMYLFLENKSKSTIRIFGMDILPNWERLKLVIISVGMCLLCTGLSYHFYGYKFLYETYLYHIVRKDTRHNFSVYFYMLYLSRDSAYSGMLALAAFIPQVILLIIISVKYYKDLSFCCFLHTFVFVAFNKVCTSQYFLWYLCLLPVIVPRLKMSAVRAVLLVILWFLVQVLWLIPAYYLEFEGKNTFLYIWAAGIFMFLSNITILYQLIKAYLPLQTLEINKTGQCLER